MVTETKSLNHRKLIFHPLCNADYCLQIPQHGRRWVSYAPSRLPALYASWNAPNDLRLKRPLLRKSYALSPSSGRVPAKVRRRRRIYAALQQVDRYLVISPEEVVKSWLKTNRGWCRKYTVVCSLWRRRLLGTQNVYNAALYCADFCAYKCSISAKNSRENRETVTLNN